MKATKKIFSILVILIALVITSMQNTNAQATVYVPWDSEACDECPSPGDWVWRVDIAVVDECGEENVIVYEDYQIIAPPDNDATFVLDEFCHHQSLEECYMVVAVVKKLCPDGHGGFTVICSGKDSGQFKSCPWLMTTGNFLQMNIVFM